MLFGFWFELIFDESNDDFYVCLYAPPFSTNTTNVKNFGGLATPRGRGP